MNILMIAAENDALPGGKVGGIGDVIRDLPPALGRLGQRVSVITPGYRQLSQVAGATLTRRFDVSFAGKTESLELYRVPGSPSEDSVDNWVLEHDLFAAGGAGTIYCTRDREPFATDAQKFVLFCSAVAEALKQGHLPAADLLHCHDWHAAPLLLLRAADPRFGFLRELPAIYTIHNLSIQGVRPLRDNRSSLQSWFPDLEIATDPIADPRYPDCINWMRAGINLADRVQTVSPTYAREILRPTNAEQHFIGGEGLEADLRAASDEGRLSGVLNGCDYSGNHRRPVGKGRLCQIAEASLDSWVDGRAMIPSAHFRALQGLNAWRAKRKREDFVVTSVGRLTAQKNRLLRETIDGRSVLEHLLERLHQGFFILLGSGDADYEGFFTRVAAERDNFLFLQGYSDELATALYSYGDLFMMPSSFEPCGISQLLAMRAGTPCLVHNVGGLADTVRDGETGFTFRGKDLQEQARNLLVAFEEAMKLKVQKPPRWHQLCTAAADERFTWEDSARTLLERVYRAPEPAPGQGPRRPLATST